MVTMIIVGVLLVFLGFFWEFTPLYLLGGIFVGYAIMGLDVKKEPSAMDVYRGKTTLEITYKDGIAIDSIVVFKYK